jgi:phosphatidylglycerophosphate synthase
VSRSSHLRASVASTASIVLVALAAVALAVRTFMPVSVWYPVKAVGVFSIVMLLAVMWVAAHHPFARFGPANQVTTARAALVALVAGLIGEPATPEVATLAVAVSLVVTLLDGFDGPLARRAGTASSFGARFDMETDAALILVLAVLAWQNGKAGAWVLLSGLLRYLFIMAGWCWSWMRKPLPSSLRGRAICVVQIGVLVIVLVPSVPPPRSAALAAFGLAALSYSFLVDTWWLWRQAGGDRTVRLRASRRDGLE